MFILNLGVGTFINLSKTRWFVATLAVGHRIIKSALVPDCKFGRDTHVRFLFLNFTYFRYL